MGICASKQTVELVAPPAGEAPIEKGAQPASDRLLPPSKKPPTLEEARNSDDGMQRGARLSVKYQAKELVSGRMSAARRSSTPFDRARIGTHTRHGIMPGPRGFSAAKINQDRGVVCWPFNGSYNQALLCVFDGHGSKGERASEFCMKNIPDLLEQDAAALKADPAACISKSVIRTDRELLGGELGRVAMTCGTTSTVCYMLGNECWTGCSGDSRAVKGARVNGSIVAEDLSIDHKPDLPEERARILAAGGTVSDGSAGRPARVWAHGRIGLAMSRSIGDGECKVVGVIPDPTLTHVTLQPCERAGADGDLFVIVASDGVWEFIESDEGCAIVSAHKNATDACTALVQEAALRWKKFEGSYRDDITCIVAFLPFLESGWADEEEADEDANDPNAAPVDEEVEEGAIYLNMGQEGLSTMTTLDPADQSIVEEGDDDDEATANVSAEFAARRLSVHNPFDEDWNDTSADGEEAEEPSKSAAAQ